MRPPAPFVTVIAALAALAWVTLALWEGGPYGRYLSHGAWIPQGAAAEICHAVPGGAAVLAPLLYVAGWLLMSVAMMLPSILPLLAIFRRVASGRQDRALLLGLVIAGYLMAWTLFGCLAQTLDGALHRWADAAGFAQPYGWLVGALAIAVAGAFEVSPWKHFCLDRCRTPLSFVMRHWRGRAARRRALLLGLHHGLFCIGCCWALMLVMFAVGMGNVGVMLALGAVMAVEKTVRWGRRMSLPLGTGLVAWAALIAVTAP